MLSKGDRQPSFNLPDQHGKEQTLSDLTRKKGLVLYEYPLSSVYRLRTMAPVTSVGSRRGSRLQLCLGHHGQGL